VFYKAPTFMIERVSSEIITRKSVIARKNYELGAILMVAWIG